MTYFWRTIFYFLWTYFCSFWYDDLCFWRTIFFLNMMSLLRSFSWRRLFPDEEEVVKPATLYLLTKWHYHIYIYTSYIAILNSNNKICFLTWQCSTSSILFSICNICRHHYKQLLQSTTSRKAIQGCIFEKHIFYLALPFVKQFRFPEHFQPISRRRCGLICDAFMETIKS